MAETTGGKTAEYGYDMLNRQIYVHTADGREQKNRYDGEGLRAGLTENGRDAVFVFYGGEILTECDAEQVPTRRLLKGNRLTYVQTIEDDAFHAYHQDEQGSTAYITNGNGQIENIYQYDAFGNVLASRESIRNRMLYACQQYDRETCQYYLRARYYNPAVGRFIQEDTCHGDGLNLYAYCGNNPVVYHDPSGNTMEYSDDLNNNLGQTKSGGVGSSINSRFRNGELYEDFIEVEGHRIEALAEIEIVEDKLILRDIAIYSNEGDIPNKIGASAMKKWLATVKEAARSQGFKQVQIIGQRAQHSTSANPGSIIDRIFNLE